MSWVSGAPAVIATGPETLVAAMHDAMRAMLRRLQPVLEAEGISMGQFWGLHAISSLGPTSVHTAADRLRVSAPTACASFDALERGGLVERRRSSSDRRVVELVLTPKGRRAEARVWKEIGRTMGRCTRELPSGDLRSAERVFRSVVDRLEPFRPSVRAPRRAA